MPRRLPGDAPACAPPPGVTPLDVPGTAPGLPEAFAALGARHWPRVNAGDLAADVCWFYEGERRAPMSLPRIMVSGHVVGAARVFWELSGRGSLERVSLICLCRNSLCVRPSHWGAQSQLTGKPHRGLADLLAHAARPGSRPAPASAPASAPAAAPGTPPPPMSSPVLHAPPAGMRVALPATASATASATAPAAFLALLAVPGVAVWRTPLGDLTHVFTPWGNFWHDDWDRALALALAARPAQAA